MKRFLLLLTVSAVLGAGCVRAQGSGAGTGTGAASATATVSTPAPPAISSFTCPTTTATTITCTWTTDTLSTTKLDRGTNGGPWGTNCSNDLTLTLSHSATCSGLTASTTYHIIARSTDNYAQETTAAADVDVATDASGDPTPPGLTDTSAYVPPHASTTQPKQSCSAGVARVSNVVTATVSGCTVTTNPAYVSGFNVVVSGCSVGAFNGTFALTGVTGPVTLTWAQTASDDSATGCTVGAAINATPAQGSSLSDPVFSTSLVRFWDRTNSPTSGSGTHHHYASRSPFNKPATDALPTYALLRSENDGYFVVDMTSYPTMSLKCDPSGSSNGIDAVWSRTDSNLYYYGSGTNTLKSQSVSACSTGSTAGQTTVKTFSEYTSIQIGWGEGDISLDGQYIPIVGLRASDGRYDHFCYDWNADAKTSVYTPATTSAITDHNYCFDDGSQFIRFNVNGKNVSSISRTSNVITVTVASAFNITPSVGEKVRIFFGQRKSSTAATLNGLWTVCGPPDAGCSTPTSTVLTLTSVGGDVASISGAANGWQVGTQWDGMIYVTDSSGTGVFNNSAAATGNHNARGVMSNGKKVIVRESNSQGFSPCGSGNTGWSKLYLAKADWPSDGANDEAQGTCLRNFGSSMSGGGHIGCEGRFCIMTHQTSMAEEASLGSTWSTSWAAFFNEIVLVDLDTDVLYRVGHHRARNTNNYFCGPRAALGMSDDGGAKLPMMLMLDSSLGGNCSSNGTGADQYVIRLWTP